MASQSASQKWWETPPPPPEQAPPPQWWAAEPRTPPPPTAESSAGLRFIGNLASDLNPINIAKGAWGLISDPYEAALGPLHRNYRKVIPAIKEGRFTDAANAVAASVPIIGPAAEAKSAQWKSGDRAGAAGGITAMIIAPEVYGAFGQAAKATARQLGKTVLAAEPAVLETALKERAMPGVVRSGLDRASRRATSADSDLLAAVDTAPHTPINMTNVVYSRGPMDALDAIRTRWNAAPASGEAQSALANAKTNPKVTHADQAYARPVLNLSRGSYAATAGDVSPAALMERAVAEQGVREVGRSIPRASAPAERVIALRRLEEAYRQNARQGVAPGMLPTFEGRLAISTANRAIGPTAQTIYKAGQGATALPPNVIRALLMSELFNRSGGGSE